MSDPYSTHLPALREFVPHGTLHVIEFGCGLYSTPLLCERAASVLSIEMQDDKWLKKVREHLIEQGVDTSPHGEWEGIGCLGPWDWLRIDLDARSLDVDLCSVALVDGHGDSRWGVVNYLMRREVPVIIAHDTEARRYGWGKIEDHGRYKRTDFKDVRPWTTVWEKIA